MVFAAWIQTVMLAITAGIVVWYTIETHRMRVEMVRQNSISLRPVVVFDFQQDAAHNRVLWAKNIGRGAAFNITTSPINVVPGMGAWDIHFERIHSLGIDERKQVAYGMPVLGSRDSDRGHIFFPQGAEKLRELRIEYQDVEGDRYHQDLTIHPREEESPSGEGYVTYAPIQRL